MNKALSLFVLALFLLASASLSYAQGRFKVTVSVVDQAGNPLSGASVSIVDVSGKGNERFSGVSDQNGNAVIKIETIFGGVFDIRASKPLYKQGTKTRFTAYGDARDKDKGVEVTLEDDVTGVEIVVHLTDQATGYKVYGAPVTLTGRLSSSAYETSSTDENGDAIFHLNKTGSFTISISSDLFERYETPITINTGERRQTISISLKKKIVKGRKNAEFFVVVTGKDEEGKVVPLKGARVSIPDRDGETATTDEKGVANLRAEIGIGDEVILVASADGYKTAQKVAKISVNTLGAAGGIFDIFGGEQFQLERNPSKSVKFIVEVRDGETNEPVAGAQVRVMLPIYGADYWPDTTDREGLAHYTGTLTDLPAEQARKGFRVQVSKDGYQEKWSDVSPELLQTDVVRRFTVYISKADDKFVGTWNCTCNISIVLNKDHTGAWVDKRNGPAGSMYESGTFTGTWSSSGDTADLTIPKEKWGRRGGTVVLKLAGGKLSDQFGDVYAR